MANAKVWPGLGALVPVPIPAGAILGTGGATVVQTDYIMGLLTQGLLLTYDPLGLGLDPAIDYTGTVVSSSSGGASLSGYLCTDLATLAGAYANQVIYVSGYNTVLDGGEGFVRWNATSTATADLGTVFGTLTVGRWERMA